jgi:hypothetical protein
MFNSIPPITGGQATQTHTHLYKEWDNSIDLGNQGLPGADKQGRYLLLQILHKIT